MLKIEGSEESEASMDEDKNQLDDDEEPKDILIELKSNSNNK
jgi:hypothetical protein